MFASLDNKIVDFNSIYKTTGKLTKKYNLINKFIKNKKRTDTITNEIVILIRDLNKISKLINNTGIITTILGKINDKNIEKFDEYLVLFISEVYNEDYLKNFYKFKDRRYSVYFNLIRLINFFGTKSDMLINIIENIKKEYNRNSITKTKTQSRKFLKAFYKIKNFVNIIVNKTELLQQ